MEEQLEIQENPGFLGRIRDMFTTRDDNEADDAEPTEERRMSKTHDTRSIYRSHVTVRRQIVSFEDAIAAAQGMKRGEHQVMNLTMTEPSLREKIKDFMCGVNFSQEGTWEEIGDHMYIVVPATVFVEVAPASPRQIATRN
jgi:cell division inhibitor SepF